MDIRTLTGEVSVAAQIGAADLPTLRDAGFKSIVCNRPDSEGADQPNFSEIERAAQMPRGVHWIKSAVAAFEPDRNAVILDRRRVVKHGQFLYWDGMLKGREWMAKPEMVG